MEKMGFFNLKRKKIAFLEHVSPGRFFDSISGQFFHFIIPENTRKPLDSGGIKMRKLVKG